MTRTFGCLLLAAACFCTTSVSAQEDVPLGEFSALRFVPAPGNHNFLMTDGARVEGHLVPWAGLLLDYAHRPFVLYDASCAADDETNCTIGAEERALVEYYFAAHLM